MTCSNYQWGENSELLGPLGIDYVYLHQCTFDHMSGVFGVVMILWVCFLMNTLATTASNYFSPTLGSISDKLNLSYDIAGVTFLAFGNGAPDFFSLIASFSGGADELVGVGALLGGSVFVCTIVVGTIAVLCPCEVSKEIFWRDVSFHLLATFSVTVIAIIQHIHLWVAFGLLFLYAIYVMAVTKAHEYVLSKLVTAGGLIGASGTRGSGRQFSGDVGTPLTKLSQMTGESIQTAFWHAEQSPTDSALSVVNKPQYHSVLSSQHASKSGSESQGSGGYSFLILDEDDGEAGEDSSDEEEAKELRRTDDTINLSGGYVPAFETIIIEDYCCAPLAGSQDMHGVPIYGAPAMFAGDDSERDNGEVDQDAELLSTAENPLSTSLLGSSVDARGDLAARDNSMSLGRISRSSGYRAALTSLYWKQWSLRKRFPKRHLWLEWDRLSIFEKVVLVSELPATVLRDLTIPTLEDDNWSKLYAMIHPVADLLLAAFVFGDLTESTSSIPVVLLCLLLGVVPSIAVYVLTHHNKVPSGRVFSTTWALVAFCMCIVWIYMLAGELVSCLSALGIIMHTPPAFLGLTVLAWGNSVGDLFTNTAVARRGLGEMAIAGCYGGPVFNILVGFGATLVMATSNLYPQSLSVVLDASSIISLVFLFVTLSSTLAIVSVRQYRIERWFGYYLWGIYGVYTVCQSFLLIF